MAMDLSWHWQFLSSSLAIAVLLTLTVAQQPPLRHFCLDNSGNFTQNSTYETNLNALLSSFSRNTPSNHGFYNFTSGQPGSNVVNAVALCRGDLNSSTSDCFNCINTANAELRNRCPYQREAIIWYDFCMFRYTNRSILGVLEFTPNFVMQNSNDVVDVGAFNQALGSLLDNLRTVASSGTALGKFSTGSAQVTPFQRVYARVHCTNDLAEYGCRSCLSQVIVYIPRYLDGKQGGRISLPCCNLRFEIVRFYNLTAADIDTQSPLPSIDPPTTGSGNESNSSRTTIIIAVSAVAFSLLLISCFIFIILRLRKPKLKPQKYEATEAADEITTPESLQYDFNTIRAATNGFSGAHKLGQGGFGAVYKGTLAGGKLIAVKRLSSNSGQGELEFKNEVQLMANLQHRNLVRLLGFCLEGVERLLIYEFVPNGSLDKILFDPVKQTDLNWEIRYKVIEGIARGLLYLHQDSRLRIIHRDLKASNILLDAEMTPKIADFGMARLCAFDQTQGATSRIVGTYGYMAPEYVMHGQFSVKSDVFSFGVLVLEILNGQMNSCFRNGSSLEDLLSFAWRNWEAGTALDVVDPCLREGSRTDLMRCIHIGLLCVQKNLAQRPNMASIVLMLTSYSSTLPLPSEPAFVIHSRTPSAMQRSEDFNSGATTSSQSRNDIGPASDNELSITEMYPR
ncbi:cysteine-rich RLK (RECEPTOR-like protein kinase) 26 [Hibiscus trionum]|uniref:Cysteine-rich RLK (RECEPTOR-like protein kinase) 26 n=1 Tax=Hibiscus trionum TaxID=183268 RepID=A0A9W7LWS3_HIBTR|nr:cysteine-rich RLK (RECEPTOR-like protein kinase) 26 [Hibiscus trionum]